MGRLPNFDKWIVRDHDGNGYTISVPEEDGEFIRDIKPLFKGYFRSLAVNSHDQLVEVCKLLQNYYDGVDGPQYNLIDYILPKLREAIKQAEKP